MGEISMADLNSVQIKKHLSRFGISDIEYSGPRYRVTIKVLGEPSICKKIYFESFENGLRLGLIPGMGLIKLYRELRLAKLFPHSLTIQAPVSSVVLVGRVA